MCWPHAKLAKDGRADDGNIDPSDPACRACVWSKRFKPGLFDQGIQAYWFDDDERDKFHPPPGKPASMPAVNCSAHAGEDFAESIRVKGSGAYFNGTTAAGCCDSCTNHVDPGTGEPDCLSWTYAPLAQPPHPTGSCWLLARVGTVQKRANRISGGQMSPPSPAPKSGRDFYCGPAEFCGMAMAGDMWAQMAAEGIQAGGDPGLDNQPLLLARNVWAGAAKYGVALWSSDIDCTWKEFRAQIGVGLSAGLSGIPYWSSDVAGFNAPGPTPELAARWHQFGSVCPLYRTHGSRAWNEPWSFGPAAEASITKSIQLREALHPYIVELVANASEFGTPLIRPVWWEFPADANVAATSEAADSIPAFMFGNKYLVAPVTTNSAREWTVYLPATPGGWIHYYSRATFPGGANVTVPAPFDELPLFERAV